MNRNELKKLVPHGYGKVIADKAGVTQKYVSLYLNNKIDSQRIELAAMEVVAELKRKRARLVKQIMK